VRRVVDVPLRDRQQLVYLAAVFDARSRRVIGYVISSSIDARGAVRRGRRPRP
jgi:hypothetical protein